MPLLVGAFLANAADLDFFLVFALHSRGWHRGFSHSIMFALVVGLIVTLSSGKRHIREAAAYGLAFASHGVLDYLTTKEGGGVQLLWPFTSDRLVFGWVGLSELPSRLPAVVIAKSLAVELLLFTPPFILVLMLKKYARRRVGAAESAI
jgi:inner membrane protein